MTQKCQINFRAIRKIATRKDRFLE